ncbi:unnamed protein product [Sphagnum jensenii]|uniref:Uncharacterized protein n=1 Tax=Sphagnum jensenii TaxID=128206 RepID=A0ABP1BZ80_9BRYO
MGCCTGVVSPSVQACRCRTTAGTSSTSTTSSSCCTNRSLRQLRPPWSTRPPPLLSLQFSSSSSSQSVVTTTSSMRSSSSAESSYSELPAPVVKQRFIAEDADVSSISEWELDFCSRPILDARGKKLWEIVVCDNRRQLQFACFYPNNVINSVTLRDALASIVETLGVPKPEKIRFFRSQMQTIISKACKELDIQPVPSQRCITLVRWLEERYETVYRRHPGFQEGATPLSLQEQALPLDLPDTLRGEQWTFVQLPLSGVLEELEAVEKGAMFGSVLDLDTLGIDLSSDIMIPGVAVASSRATPLAAWTNALELASIEVDIQRSCLILSTGVADRWRYAFYRKSRQADAEGEAWESAKKSSGGLHFLAVQESLDSELCTGFWLLIDVQRSPV